MGLACCSSISDTAVAPSAEVSAAIATKFHVNLGTPTLRTSETAAEAVPLIAATLLVASTEADGIPVVANSTAMSRASMRLLCPT